jgi:hydroxypyruvate isomerase
MELGLCIEMALTDRPFEQRLAKAAELGFTNVEMWFVDGSYKGKGEDLARVAAKHALKITNTVIGSPDGSIGGGLTNPKNRPQWLERTKMTLAFNRAAGIPATVVCTGNETPGMSDARMTASMVEGLKATVELAEKADVTLLLEPLNTRYDHPGYWLVSSDRGADICRKMNSPRMKMLFDCYHMQIMEGDLVGHIKRNIDVIGHFHSAGVPGRHELFDCEINYPFLLRQIESLGYKGVFALEYAPLGGHEESLRKVREHLSVKRP